MTPTFTVTPTTAAPDAVSGELWTVTDRAIQRGPEDGAPPRFRLTAVIPAKNEARNLGWVLERLPVSVDEVVIVDGHSTDGTPDVARAIRRDVVIVSEATPGKGAALRAGFEAARGDFVVMLDADGSMDPGEIDRFAEVLAAGADFAKGSRFARGGGTADMTVLRWLGNWGFVKLTNLLFRSKFSDLCYGYCAFRRDRLPALALTAQGFEIETELVLHALKAGLVIAELPSFEAPRRFGESNLNTFRDGWRVLRTILRERVAPLPRVESAPRNTADVLGRARHLRQSYADGVKPVTVVASRGGGFSVKPSAAAHRAESLLPLGLAETTRGGNQSLQMDA